MPMRTEHDLADLSEAPGPVMRGSAPRRAWVSVVLVAGVFGLFVWSVVAGTRALDGGRERPAVPPPAQGSTVERDEAAVAALAEDVLDAWSRQRWQRLQRLISDQSLDAASVHRQAHEVLRVTEARFQSGRARLDGDRAVVPFRATWEIADLGTHEFRSEVTLRRTRRADGARRGWRVAWWYPTVHPDLTPEARFERVRLFPRRAPILGRGGRRLAVAREVVVIGFEPRRVERPGRAARAVARASGKPVGALRRSLRRKGLTPTGFYELATVPRGRYERHRGRLRRVDGLVFRVQQQRTVRIPGAEQILGRTGDITAEQLEALGDDYAVGDVVGLSGLERRFERRLAGRPQLEARIVDDIGLVRSLAFRDGERPRPVHTTLDPRVQRAAQRALRGGGKPAAIVVVHARTGALLAAANRSPDGQERALSGSYPPGSTFKIVTAAAAILDGRRRSDTVGCPGQIAVGDRPISNAGGFALGRVTLTRAFARSCNTTFARQALAVGPDGLTAAAAQFGFNTDYSLGVATAGGSVPRPASEAELARAGIGQARVLTSPLHLASVSAATASGTWRTPHLLRGAKVKERPLDRRVRRSLPSMMRAVVTSGTGTAANVRGRHPVRGKTGSAEFGTKPPFGTHAWFAGYRGNLGFAVFVEGGGGGGAVAAPIAAEFLRRL